uniref:Uncharacterized protein n=1 Tax=Solanum lycopersicum TaxID=4081 RepID=A0A3Q7HI52_SOLLC
MYINDVVWIKIPIDATVALGLTNNPHNKIIISYHHHSKQTLTQLGIAKSNNDFHPLKQSNEIELQVLIYTFDTTM